MTAKAKLAAYTLVLLAACGAGAAVGAAVGPERGDDDLGPAVTEPAGHENHDR